jgi:hypothetical protein
MDTPDIAGPLHWIRISLPLALILVIGGFAASALNAYSVGYVLFGFAGLNAGAGFVLLLVVRNRMRSHVREIQVRQRADLDGVFRSDTR